MPPPNPVTTLRATKVPRLGAKADANTPMASNESSVKATGLLPKESDMGPTDIAETAQAANVAVASWPATATEVSNSVAMATNNGANINDAVIVVNSPTATAARKRNRLIYLWTGDNRSISMAEKAEPKGPAHAMATAKQRLDYITGPFLCSPQAPRALIPSRSHTSLATHKQQRNALHLDPTQCLLATRASVSRSSLTGSSQL